MVLFYTENIENDIAFFYDEECRHMNNAMRKATGDDVHFIDGKGTLYSGEILDISKRKAKVQIKERTLIQAVEPYLHIGIAPTKNMDRIEWFIEKAVEIGINEISFLICKHSERKQIKMERIRRIIIAACKQSKKATLPIVNEAIPFDSWIEKESNAKQSFIACLHESTQAITKVYLGKESARICIGPEGGFRESEIKSALENGFTSVSLGNQRLRTETAGIFAVSNIRVINEL